VVTYVPPGAPRRALGVLRAARRGRPLQSGLYGGADLRRRLDEHAPRVDLAVLQLARLVELRDALGTTPCVVDLVDSLSLNFRRRAEVDRWWLRPLLRLEARRLLAAERRLVAGARATLVVCERDRRALTVDAGADSDAAARVVVVPIVAPPAAPPSPPSPRGPHPAPTLALTGNLGYFVNDDAARWFLTAVWPALRQTLPEGRLLVAGERPSRRLRRHLAATAGAELVASPPDLRELLAGATVALAPMRCGSGVPLKVLDAWAAGVPVVASPWAAAGTTAVPGEDLLVVERPDDWVSAIVSLVRDVGERQRLASNARRRLHGSYAAEVVKGTLLAALATVAAEAVAGQPARARA
jgi:glycosyltransferase involved in cell wall biosynthesis